MTRSSVTRSLGGGGSTGGGPATYRATADQSTSSASLVGSTYLTFSASSNTVYFIDASVFLGGAAGGQLGIVAPAGATGTWDAGFSAASTSFNAGVYSISAVATPGNAYRIMVTIHVGATSGTVAIGILNASGFSTSIFKDSVMIVYAAV